LGGERQFVEICKRWAFWGHELHVVGTEYSIRLCREFGFKPCSCYSFKPRAKLAMGFDEVLNLQRMCSLIPKENFHFIYCPNESFEYVFPSVIAKKLLSCPLVVSVNLLHPMDINFVSSLKLALEYSYYRGIGQYLKSIPDRLRFAFKKILRINLLRKADLIFAISRHVQGLLLKAGIDEKRVYLTSSGIDVAQISSVNAEGKVFDACFVGAIIPRKGVLDLVKAWRIVVNSKLDAKLAIVGGGSGFYINRVKQYIADNGLQNNVIMTGFVSEKEKYKTMKASKIFVFPSYLESFAIVVCEALACGLPVVAYELPAYRDFYGSNLAYVSTGNVKGLAAKIIELLDDADMREKLAKAGSHIAKKYDWYNVAKQQIKAIKRIVNKKMR
jgi:glycosyltransferase involved in cell wall biosynthesis